MMWVCGLKKIKIWDKIFFIEFFLQNGESLPK